GGVPQAGLPRVLAHGALAGTEVSTQHSQSAAAFSSALLVGHSQADRGASERSSNQAIPGQSDPQPLSRSDRPRAVERRSLLTGRCLERDRTPARPNRLAGSGRRTQWASLSSLRQGISGVGTGTGPHPTPRKVQTRGGCRLSGEPPVTLLGSSPDQDSEEPA